jgi:hypothetical protein
MVIEIDELQEVKINPEEIFDGLKKLLPKFELFIQLIDVSPQIANNDSIEVPK